MRSIELTKSEARRQVRLAVVNEVWREMRSIVEDPTRQFPMPRGKLPAWRAIESVVSDYNEGRILIEPWHRAAYRNLAVRTVYGWYCASETDGLSVLSDRRGQISRPSKLSQSGLREFVYALFEANPSATATDIMNEIRAVADERSWCIPSHRTLHRELAKMRAGKV